MKRCAIRIAGALALAVAGAAWAEPPKDEQPLRLGLDLSDGSHVIGVPNLDSVSVQTPYARMDIPLKQIRSMKIGKDHEAASIDMRNGDTLKGVVSLEPTKLRTVFGSVSIGIELIKEIRVMLPGRAREGLVALWSGDGNAMDSAGGLKGTLFGDATYGPGRVGQGFVFSGRGGGVDLGNPKALQLQEFTIEAWVKRASTSVVSYGSGGNAQLFGYGLPGYMFLMDWSGGIDLSSSANLNFAHGPLITDTHFHHVAVTKAKSEVIFYVDGVASSPITYEVTFGCNTAVGIGCRADNHDNSFLGTIDEVAIYNRALSADEIREISKEGDSN